MKYLTLTLLFLLNVLAHAEPMDKYYSNDINTAVDTARQQTHHYDYSTVYRYKRTTAQSIELKKLDLDELDETRLTMDANVETTDKNQTNVATNSVDENTDNEISIEGNLNQKLPVQALPISINSIYSSNQGDMSSTGILQGGQVVSTPRP
ncbi:hypothetical protein [Bermanella sp. R86510]|uniref:hypothetical protein n=1 Tax=unclassified Bermanella TaxID=2627862 RepID=UPI0037C4F23D